MSGTEGPYYVPDEEDDGETFMMPTGRPGQETLAFGAVTQDELKHNVALMGPAASVIVAEQPVNRRAVDVSSAQLRALKAVPLGGEAPASPARVDGTLKTTAVITPRSGRSWLPWIIAGASLLTAGGVAYVASQNGEKPAAIERHQTPATDQGRIE